MKTLIGINTLTSIDQFVYSNHIHFAYRLGRMHPDTEFILFTPPRMSIDAMRNCAARMALEQECDYLMFIDDDVLIPFDTYKHLVSRNVDIVAGWTQIRGGDFPNMFFRYDKPREDGGKVLVNYKDFEKPEDGLLRVAAVGFSCVLIKTEVLKKVEPPFFVTGPFNTEDVYFCLKAEHSIPDLGIYVDLNIHTEHKLDSIFVSPDNVDHLKKFFCYETPKADRGDDYVRRIGLA